MKEHDWEELQVVELPKNMKDLDGRICDGLEIERNQNGEEWMNMTARRYKSWSYKRI